MGSVFCVLWKFAWAYEDEDPGFWIQDPSSSIQDPASWTKDPRAWIQNRGSFIQDTGSRIQDPGLDIKKWTTLDMQEHYQTKKLPQFFELASKKYP